MSPVNNCLRTAAVTAFVTALFGWTAGPATAHTTDIYHGDDRAWSDHSHLRVQDNECDGNGVYAEGFHNGGYFISVSDANGCASGYYHVDGTDIYRFRVCENTKGCSEWRWDV